MRAKLGLLEAADGRPRADRRRAEAAGPGKGRLHDLLAPPVPRTWPASDPEPVRDLFIDRRGFDAWLQTYAGRRAGTPAAEAAARMLGTNPKFVLRNHLGQLAIEAGRSTRTSPASPPC